jgi:hypothetical protein
MTPEATIQLTARSSIHDQLAIAAQWAAPVWYMLILAALVQVAHIVGKTQAASQRPLNGHMSWLCHYTAVLAVIMVVPE